MKLTKVVGISLLSFSLLGLGGCSNHSGKQTTSNQTSGKASNGSTASNPSKKNNSGQSTDSTQGNNQSNNQSGQNNGSSQTNDSTQGDTTSQSNSSGQGSSPSQGTGGGKNGGTSSTSHNNNTSRPAPKTEKEALSDIQASLNTRVPMMLPTTVPLASGRYLTAVTASQTWYYKVKLLETKSPARLNSETAINGATIATVEGTEYKDSASAKKAIGFYHTIDKNLDQAIDLGHGIKALGDAGLGHGYLTWNEGRWMIQMDSPNDKKYASKDYQDSVKLGKEVVAYLNTHLLPAPNKIGTIHISTWANSTKTTVYWQYHEMTYKVTSANPLTALKIAVAMKLTTK